MRLDPSDFVVAIVAAGFLFWLFDARRRYFAEREIKRNLLRNAIQVWSQDVTAREAAYRDIVNAVQAENQEAVVRVLSTVNYPTNILELYPIIRRAAEASKEIRQTIEDLVEEEARFVNVADVCANRTGRPGLLESPAFRDLRKLHARVSSQYLSLREGLEEWVSSHR